MVHCPGLTRRAQLCVRGTTSTSRKVQSASLVLAVVVGLLVAGADSAQTEGLVIETSGMAGFAVLTPESGAKVAPNTVVVTYSGLIVSPMATNLRAIWSEVGKRQNLEKLILRLDSPGGVDTTGMEVVDLLEEIRVGVTLVTWVAASDLCASMCVGVFIQGDKRVASPASSWMFHGASKSPSGVPSLSMTMRYFDLFRNRGITPGFIDFLFEQNYVTSPGAYLDVRQRARREIRCHHRPATELAASGLLAHPEGRRYREQVTGCQRIFPPLIDSRRDWIESGMGSIASISQ